MWHCGELLGNENNGKLVKQGCATLRRFHVEVPRRPHRRPGQNQARVTSMPRTFIPMQSEGKRPGAWCPSHIIKRITQQIICAHQEQHGKSDHKRALTSQMRPRPWIKGSKCGHLCSDLFKFGIRGPPVNKQHKLFVEQASGTTTNVPSQQAPRPANPFRPSPLPVQRLILQAAAKEHRHSLSKVA